MSACIAYSCPSGRDDIRARDGEREEINCGPGTDTLEADAIDVIYDSVTLVDQCEGHIGTATGPSGAPAAPRSASRGRRSTAAAGSWCAFTAPGPGQDHRPRERPLVRSIRIAVGARRARSRRAGKATLTVTPSRAAKRALRSRGRAHGDAEGRLQARRRRRRQPAGAARDPAAGVIVTSSVRRAPPHGRSSPRPARSRR